MSSDVLQPAGSSPRPPVNKGEGIDPTIGAGLHDLGNLLQVTLASAEEGLEQDYSTEALRSALENCRTATQRAVDLLHVVSNQVAGRRSPLPELANVTLRPALEEVVELMRSCLQPEVQLVFEEVGSGAVASVDPSLLHRALVNLIRNSVEAVGERGDITVLLAPAEGGRARIEVMDDGPGMDAESLRRATEQGFSSRGAGRGVGLAFVKEFARTCGGSLQIQSEPHQGTTVRLTLPSVSNTPATL